MCVCVCQLNLQDNLQLGADRLILCCSCSSFVHPERCINAAGSHVFCSSFNSAADKILQNL